VPDVDSSRCSGLKQDDEALSWLEKAYAKRSPWLAHALNPFPMFERLRPNKRSQNLLRRMNLLSP
jgi:hypothetical protein